MHTLSTRKNIKVIKIDHVSMQVPPPQSQQENFIKNHLLSHY